MFPCDWPIAYHTDPPECFADAEPEEIALYEEVAVGWLWNWTGGSFGECPTTIRPCRTECDDSPLFWGRGPYPSPGGGGYHPAYINGTTFAIGCGQCNKQQCSCGSVSELVVPGPVSAIESIVIGGEALPATAYRVDNWNLLVREDGGSWPTCQDLSAPEGTQRSWEVHYVKGRPVPAGGQVAAGILACEVAKAARKDKGCALPQRIQQITRQGVTVTLIDDFKSLDEGKTGIYLIDTWVASVMKAPRPSRVYSPDIPIRKPRVTTWRAS